MNRVASALPIVPNSALGPHIHPDGARCLHCRHWQSESNPNFGDCAFFQRTNADWSCVLFVRQEEEA